MEQTQLEWQKLLEYGGYPWWMYPKTALYPFVGAPGFPFPPKEGTTPGKPEEEGEQPPPPQAPPPPPPAPAEELTPVVPQPQETTPSGHVGNTQPEQVEQEGDTVDRRPVQEKIRHKRQTLQDMSRPLKQWLYSHKDHPYPTRSDKMALALSSEMTLTQVSNWFANARRRLKNTVKGPEMGWGKRIKLYNSCVEGNQELLSISSQDSMWDSEEEERKDKEAAGPMDLTTTNKVHETQQQPPVPISPVSPTRVQLPLPIHTPQHQHLQQHLLQQQQLQQQQQQQQQQQPQQQQQQTEHVYAAAPPAGISTINTVTSVTHPVYDVTTQSGDVCHTNTNMVNGHSPQEQPSKFKHSILQRYLNDSYEHSLQMQQQQQAAAAAAARNGGSPAERHRNPSGSLSSHDYEDISVSSRSSPVREHLVLDDLSDFEEISRQWPHIEDRAEEDLYWKEISAALALTTLAKSRFKSTSSSTVE